MVFTASRGKSHIGLQLHKPSTEGKKLQAKHGYALTHKNLGSKRLWPQWLDYLNGSAVLLQTWPWALSPHSTPLWNNMSTPTSRGENCFFTLDSGLDLDMLWHGTGWHSVRSCCSRKIWGYHATKVSRVRDCERDQLGCPHLSLYPEAMSERKPGVGNLGNAHQST